MMVTLVLFIDPKIKEQHQPAQQMMSLKQWTATHKRIPTPWPLFLQLTELLDP